MAWNKKLPAIRTLRHLAAIDGPFPTQNRHVIQAAQRYWFNEDVVQFLQLFPPNEVFHSREEFIDRCRQLELLIREERVAAREELWAMRHAGMPDDDLPVEDPW